MIERPIPMMKVEIAQFGKPLTIYVRLSRISESIAIISEDIGIIDECITHDDYRLSMLPKDFSPNVILDIGGHIGTFGLLAKSYWPEARLIAVEPNPISHFLYKLNMKENGCTNYEVLNKAISYDSQAKVLLEITNRAGCGILQRPEQAEKYKKEGLILTERKIAPNELVISNSNVETVTLEELLIDIDKVDLAKWDCEGSEIEIFRNMSKETAGKFGYMAGEYHIPDKEGNHSNGTFWDFAEFTAMTERKFPSLEFKTTPIYPLGKFWSRPLGGYEWVMKDEGLIDFREVPKRILEAIEQKSLSTLSERKRYEELFIKEKENVETGQESTLRNSV